MPNATPLTFFDAFTRFGPRPRTHGKHPWSFEHLLDELDHCSIAGALVTSTEQIQYDAMHANRKLSAKLEAYDHLFPVWHVLPHWSDECAEPATLTKQMADHDVRVVAMAPHTNNWNIQSVTSRPLFEELERTATPIILAADAEVHWTELEYLLSTFPKLPIILRQIRWGAQREVMPLVRTFKNLHVTFDHFQCNLALEWFTEKGCEDQLLFCSNTPEMAAGAHRFYVDYADVSNEARAKIAGGNLTRLLKGLAPPRQRENKNEDPVMTEARHGQPLSTTVYDMHAHMLDEGLNGAGGGVVMINGGPTGVRDLGLRMGVDRIGIMSWNGTVGVHAEDGNQCVFDAINAYPDFYWGLATFDVMHESAETMRAQMEKVYSDPRILGLKPYPQYGIPYSDARYDCWWEFGNERGLYCGIHPHNWYQGGEIESLCKRFPNLTVVAYHCGASYDVADIVIDLAKKYDNLMLEPTLTPSCCGIIDYLVKGAGADRVMYGSDLPMRDPRQQLGWVVYSKLDHETKKRVLGGNAKALIDRITERQLQATGATVS